MRTLGLVALLLLASACTFRATEAAGTSNRVASPVASRTPAPWEGPDQVTPPLPIVRSSPAPIVEMHVERTIAMLPASLAGAKLVASGGRTLYFASGRGTISAVGVRTGALRWHTDGIANGVAAASDDLLFVTSAFTAATPSSYALALSTRDGRRVIARPGYWSGAMLHGCYYASRATPGQAQAFAAYDATSGREVWSNRGAENTAGPPTLVGRTLLQSFSESGAISVNAMHAFDVVTGRELWRKGYGPRPLGTGPGVVYLDTTWFPLQLDSYVPLGVGTVDLATGTLRHEYYYKPDVARNWPRPPNTPFGATGAHVGGGFVTFEVNGAWYRYDADRDPNDAHAARLDGIDNVDAWLADTRALVTAQGGVALARWLPDRIVLQPLGNGALRNSVAASDGGTQYAVVGARMLAIDPGGVRIRALGAVPCDRVAEVIALHGSVAVRCAADPTDTAERLIDFADPLAAVAVAAAQPHAPPAPRFSLAVTKSPVPPAGPSPIDRQWWPSSIAPAPDGSLAVVLTPGGDLNRGGAIGRVTASGRVDLIRLPATEPPPLPQDVVVDAHGTMWFNDDRAATVTSLRPNGALRSLQIGPKPGPSPTPRVVVMGGRTMRIFPRPRTLGIRLAIGPDGEAWYARSHPTRAIGRVDGKRTFAVPDSIGDVQTLVGGHDGALWFLTADAVGRISLDGAFARVALPEAFTRMSYPPRRLIAGRTNTVWVADGRELAEVDAHRILRTWLLPNASSAIAALTVGCDGTVYVADTLGTQLARFAPDGSVEEHDTGLYSIDGLATASDCRMWYVGGSNAPNQGVGTFTFTPVRQRG
jgi:streptogramin lyase